MSTRPTPELDLEGLTALLQRHAGDVDQTGRLPLEAFDALRERGLLGVSVPREYGGLGLSPEEAFDVCEAIGAGCGVTSFIFDQHVTATAYISMWSQSATEGIFEMLPAAARGDRVIGLGTMPTLRVPGVGEVRVHRRNGRAYMTGTRRWFTGVGLMTDAMIAAEEESDSTAVVLGIAPMSAITVGAPANLMVLNGTRTCPIAFKDVDITDRMLTFPERLEDFRLGVFAVDSVFFAGYCAGAIRAALDLCSRSKNLTPSARTALEAIATSIRRLRDIGRAHFGPTWAPAADEGQGVARNHLYSHMLQLMSEVMALVLCCGAGSGLVSGAPHNRVAREICHLFARLPVELQIAATGAHLSASGLLEPGAILQPS